KLGIQVAVVAPNSEALKAIAPHFGNRHCHVLCQIAGKGSLVGPVREPKKARTNPSPASRIPVALLQELQSKRMPKYLANWITNLKNAYESRIASGRLDDEC